MNERRGKSIALVSGKGGSGKTMVAAVVAKLLDKDNRAVLMIDSDFATAGLTYYMGLKTVKNISVGLTNISSDPHRIDTMPLEKIIQKMAGYERTRFIGVGDHRRFYKKRDSTDLRNILESLLEQVDGKFDHILFDCRGGIDKDSLSVCSLVDEILIVAETDTTSFQATQHLVDILYDNNLSDKLSGFFINKVFDDPKNFAMNGTAAFKCQYLGSIPFDLEATRSFLIGEVPTFRSNFFTQIGYSLQTYDIGFSYKSSKRKMDFRDFKGLNIRDNESMLGGLFLSFGSMSVGIPLYLSCLGAYPLSSQNFKAFLVLLIVLGIFSGLEPVRRAFGSLFTSYFRIISKLLFR